MTQPGKKGINYQDMGSIWAPLKI